MSAVLVPSDGLGSDTDPESKTFEVIGGPTVQDLEDVDLCGLDCAKETCAECPRSKRHWYPFERSLKKGHTYLWCGCGRSTTFPFCDEQSHSVFDVRSGNGPIRFRIRKQQTRFLLCGCRLSSRKPFCDGSHISPSKFERVIREEEEKARDAAEKEVTLHVHKSTL